MKPMVRNASEAIWAGKLHVGDEPGIYGHASYVGVCVDLPVTLTPFDETSSDFDVHFEILAENVSIVGSYPGHRITVFACSTPQSGSSNWSRQIVGSDVLRSDRAEVVVQGAGSRYFIVRIEADPDVVPGLYDDFLLVALNLMSTTHYADFGFRYLPWRIA
jgi:hypothetical protein